MKENNKKALLTVCLVLVILLPYMGLFLEKKWFDRQLRQVENASFVVVDKQAMEAHVYMYNGNEVLNCPITTGKNYGNKRMKGDFKTPEGLFYIQEIQDASGWEHDFGDGKGDIQGAYGPWFLRLYTPGHKGIGIHGTHKPEMLGSRDSEGCIRLENENVDKLKKMVRPGTVVVVLPGRGDVLADMDDFCSLDSLRKVVIAARDTVTAIKSRKVAPINKEKIVLGDVRTGRRIDNNSN